MPHYTTHQGRMHHFLLWPDLEEQVLDDRSVLVAVGPRAFDDGEIVLVSRHKPGVARVLLKHGGNLRLLFSRDEFLPAGAIAIDRASDDGNRTCTVKGFYDPATGELHLQDVLWSGTADGS